ncbi:MAG: hypothetical protein PHZ26_00075 [Candidatus Gracilibacteria bacterium]|nr:hypothetical protein [Candidatus Gracilibacteria bacterium]MDD2908133.1 hypothetical protein [Candidatus Gracilibacteria bacterium]
MKELINKVKNGITQGIGMGIGIAVVGIVYATGTWTTTSPTTITNDASLYTNSGNTLTSAKWNELVNKVKVLESVPTGGSMLVKEIIVGAGTNTATTTYVGNGSAVTSVDFTGLDGNAAGGYEMDLMLVPNATNIAMGIRINNDTNIANYTNQILYSGGAGVYANIAPPNGFITAANNKSINSFANINIFSNSNNINYISNSRFRFNMEYLGLYGTRYTNTSANLTSLSIQGYTNGTNTIVSSTIGVGSTFRLYKRK